MEEAAKQWLKARGIIQNALLDAGYPATSCERLAEAIIARLAKEKMIIEEVEEEKKKDWRIGLTVRPKLRSNEMYYERCEVVAVHPSGTAGIYDPDGVLMLRSSGGRVFLNPASEWVTA